MTVRKCRSLFRIFFADKITLIRESIRSALQSTTDTVSSCTYSRLFTGTPLSVFSAVTVDEVAKLINSMPNKSSPLDVLPTSLLKSCSDIFAPTIARIANLSFASGTFPAAFKIAQVLPLLKKQGMDRSLPDNYRPISNLNTISKIVERLALCRLNKHVLASGNFNAVQSAYRVGHSTETALLHVLDSTFTAIDNQRITALIALDISAAFDTINHSTLLRRLQSVFGLSEMALDWIDSYISNRRQYVKLGRHHSESTACSSGIAQGSVLGPILFSLYVSPVGDVISAHGVQHHQYADDTQLFFAMKASTIDDDIQSLEICSSAVRRWFLENDLLLNADKSEVMFVGTPAQLRKADRISTVEIACVVLPVSSEVKSLGVIIDSRLSFKAHVNAVAKACNYHIWALRHIRPLLSQDVAHTLACSMVISKLDYCNAVLQGAPKTTVAILQRVQNSLARLVLQHKKFASAKTV